MENVEGKRHKITFTDRSSGMITGVIQINEFDNNEISLDTVKGKIIIKGKEMKVKGLNIEKGEAEITGNIDSITYHGKTSGDSIIKKMFK